MAAQTINSRLLPFRLYDSVNDVFTFWSLEADAVAGSFVKVKSANPDEMAKYASTDVGGDYSNVTSKMFNVVNRIELTTGGENKHQVLGMTLMNVETTDDNGLPLKLFPDVKTRRKAVLPGEAVPVVKRGLFMLSTDAIGSGTAGIDKVAVISSTNGKIDAVAATDVGSGTDPEDVVGTFRSSVSTKHGGRVLFELQL